MLAKWNPFANGGIERPASQMPGVDDLFREADRLFEGTLAFPSGWNRNAGFPPADIYETQDELVLKMDLPGYDPKTVDVQVEADVLTVTAERTEQAPGKAGWLRRERPHGKFARSFVLPSSVDASKCEANAQHGVLTLTLPKREETKPRSIAVKVNG